MFSVILFVQIKLPQLTFIIELNLENIHENVEPYRSAAIKFIIILNKVSVNSA